MQTINIWHKLHLQRKQKIGLILALIVFLNLPAFSVQAQRSWLYRDRKGGNRYTQNISNSLQRQRQRLTKPIAFGFFLAPLGSTYSEKFSDAYINTPNFIPEDSPVQSPLINVQPKSSLGFAVGFYSNFRLSEFWDARVQINAAFYERQLEYIFANGETITKVVESPMLELPLLLKYRSQLRGITGMYMIGGIKPAFVLSRRTEEDANIRPLSTDLSVEFGVGFDVFFPYFKFAPELRFSKGLVNTMDTSEINAFNQPLKRLTTNTFILYFNFGG
ncbi:MAG: outer membrane beta-barrel protein [Microscillaceae bacterium]|nr:outer membrane beta-barrel protein [Microscillaceae bacterium]